MLHWTLLQRGVARADEGIARILALQHRGQHEAGRQFHRHVLQRMHRQVRAALLEGGFQLLDEQALAAHLAERAVEDLVALGRHAEQGDFMALLGEQGLHMLGLPQGQAAFSGGYRQFHRGVRIGRKGLNSLAR